MYTMKLVEKTLREHRETVAKVRMYELYLREPEEGIFLPSVLMREEEGQEAEVSCEEATANAEFLPLSKRMVRAKLERLRAQAQLVEAWLTLLSTEERFILEVHTIGGLDWPRTLIEHEKQWGYEQGRSERTLKRIQQRAIRRIAQMTSQWIYGTAAQ